VATAINQATATVEQLGKSMQTIASGAEEAGAAAEESRAAINQIEKHRTRRIRRRPDR
jgi:methyl-accepting chemotaxis protein